MSWAKPRVKLNYTSYILSLVQQELRGWDFDVSDPEEVAHHVVEAARRVWERQRPKVVPAPNSPQSETVVQGAGGSDPVAEAFRRGRAAQRETQAVGEGEVTPGGARMYTNYGPTANVSGRGWWATRGRVVGMGEGEGEGGAGVRVPSNPRPSMGPVVAALCPPGVGTPAGTEK